MVFWPDDMRLEKTLLRNGDTVTFPNAGDMVVVRYTLWSYDSAKIDGKGNEWATIDHWNPLFCWLDRLDSSHRRGNFTTQIGQCRRLVNDSHTYSPDLSRLQQGHSRYISAFASYPCGSLQGLTPRIRLGYSYSTNVCRWEGYLESPKVRSWKRS